MSLSKTTFIDGKTIISAKFLNDLQDELSRQDSTIERLDKGGRRERLSPHL